jgi:hypothetical protein
MPNKAVTEQQKLAARTSVLDKLRLSLISPTEAKHRLIGLGVSEKLAVTQVARVVNDTVIDGV